eukprot:m.144786 g.144786  ORF g.144786 m.144786 type:complete len:490 (-) comp30396_c0_seq1:203-1672(-)
MSTTSILVWLGAMGCVSQCYCSGNSMIRPGLAVNTPHWNDTDGNRIESHAAGMLQSPIDNKWYWYGESKKTSNLSDHGVNLYSSASLTGPWKFEGQVIHQSMIPVPTNGSSGPFIIERPKTLYNEKTKKFVCWFHLDTAGYKFRHVGIFSSDSPTGPFVFERAMQPDGIPSLDMSLYKDPVDGVAYFIRSCDNKYAGFSRLSDDYLNSTGIITTHPVFEGMALFRHSNGTYYIITSHLTGWSPNPLMLFRAAGKTLDDPQWVSMGNPTNSATSYNSQPTYVVEVTTDKGVPYFMYMADNWVHGGPGGLIDASYIWLPFVFDETSVHIPELWEWDVNNPFAPAPPPPAPPQPVCGYSVGQKLTLSPCATTPSNATKWAVENKQIRLSASQMCLGATSSQSASPLVLVDCSTATSDVSIDSGEIKLDGLCVDAAWCSQSLCPGNVVELYKCGSETSHNEHYTYDSTTMQLKSDVENAAGPLCISSCTQTAK